LVAARGITARERRMLRLATMPLRECLAPLARAGVGGLSLCLALPETDTPSPLDPKAFLHRLASQVANAFVPDRSDASHVGRAGGVAAVGQGVLAIHAGTADFIIAGGIDSYRDPYVLGTLELEQRVKSETSFDGFVPGEGAAFVLLARGDAAATRGLPILATVSPVALGFERGHLYSEEPYRGDGLAATLAQLISPSGAPFGDVYSSMNGESHWAKEWGVGYIRNRAKVEDGYTMHHPADCFGDTGAACGPLLTGLAALGHRNGSRSPAALVYGSSDRGARAAIAVTAA